jgi:murein DD-endopeptidase MepM/ murein hydrolase activator NlpD
MRPGYLLVALLAWAAIPARVSAPTGPDGADWPAPIAYRVPVADPARVVRGFEPPPTRYAAGHRGVDLAVPARSAVFAAADGRVTFAGRVAGRALVVLAHADGLRTEYEPVVPVVTAGRAVRAGDLLGHIRGTHGACAPDRCLHWGARRGADYLDPLSLLARLGPVRLLPWAPGVTPEDVPG